LELYRRETVFLQTSATVDARRPRRWLLLAAGALLILAVCLAGVGLRAYQATKDRSDDIDEILNNAPPNLDADELKYIRDNWGEALRQADPARAKVLRESMVRSLRQMGQRRPGFGLAPGGETVLHGFLDPRTARLGARVEPPGPVLAEQLELPGGRGLVLREVLPDSAAAKAGLKVHDILLELNGEPVPDQLPGLDKVLADIKPDTKVDVVVLRKGKKETIKGLSLPEAKAAAPGVGGFGPPGGLAGQPGGPPGGFNPGGGLPAGVGGFGPPGGGQAVIITLSRTPERFTLRHQEGSLIITLAGRITGSEAKASGIYVQDGIQSHKYESLDEMPQQYRDKAKNLIEMSEKGNVRLEIKRP
jgi:hypothetical protein